MILKPYKRIGEPATFKGIKGPYLFMALFYSAGFLVGLLVAFLLPVSKYIQFGVVVVLVIIWLLKMNDLKKKSKSGDIKLLSKNRCRMNINIKGGKFHNEK